MSELSEKKNTITESLSGANDPSSQAQLKVKPVKVWAVIGGAVLALQLYVWIRWITGPYFERVPGGVSDPPMYMKIPLMANAIGALIGLPIAIWWFIIRPWVRERRITLDGMLLVSMGLMFFQDPFLNYFNTWCTYNTWLFNRGSWSPYVPGWVSPDSPGHQVAEPLLTNTPGYALVLLIHHRRMLGDAPDQGEMAWHQQSSVDHRHVCDRDRLRLRHGGAGHAADRVLHVPRRYPSSVFQCRHVLPMADL